MWLKYTLLKINSEGYWLYFLGWSWFFLFFLIHIGSVISLWHCIQMFVPELSVGAACCAVNNCKRRENGSGWCFTAEGYLSLSPQWARSGEVPMQSPNVHIHENLFNLFLNWLNERANVSEKNMENRIKGNLNLQFGIGSVFKNWHSSVYYMCWCYLFFFFPWPAFLDLQSYFSYVQKNLKNPTPSFLCKMTIKYTGKCKPNPWGMFFEIFCIV